MLELVPRRAGFVACALVQMWALLSSFVKVDAIDKGDGSDHFARVDEQAGGVPIEHLVIGGVLIFATIVLFGISLHKQRLPRAFWLGIGTCLLAVVALVYVQVSVDSILAPTVLAMKVMVVVSLAVLMLSVFRTSFAWYAAMALIVGTIVSITPFDVTHGMLATLAVGAFWAVSNYGVQLFLDHDAELNAFWSMSAGAMIKSATRSMFLMIPVFVLCLIGLRAHDVLQTEMLKLPYAKTTTLDSSNSEAFLIECKDDDAEGAVDAEKLKKDLLCTIDRQQENSITQMKENLAAWAEGGTDLATAAPKEVAAQISKFDPPRIDGAQACRGFTYSKKFVDLSFTSPCKGLVGYINRAMSRTHDRVAGRIQATTEKSAQDVKDGISFNKASFEKALEDDIKSSYDAGRSTVRATFVGIKFLEGLSFAILIVSLIAAFQMIQGRVLFYRPQGGASGMSFQLTGGNARAIDRITRHSMTLSEDIPGKDTWYAKLTLARRGPGTAQRVSVPQPLKCVVARLISGVYFLTRIDVEGGPDGPVVSVAGDTKLVRVAVRPGQSLCFRMSDLVAFSGGVKLQSRYSTHVGTHLLRLGTFYSIVEGSGFILLRTEGEQIADTSPGESTPSTNLLVWDEAHAFSLDQHLGMAGIWLNPPSLVSMSVRGSSVADEGATERFPIWARMWGLVRYLFLPM